MPYKNKIIGVYCILNIVSNKRYIGSSINVKNRLCSHKRRLLKGTHDNKILQNSFNKHGINNFNFFLIEETTIEHYSNLEHYYIQKYNTLNRDFGYNIRPETKTNIGIKHSEASKIKMSLNRKGKYSGKNNPFFGKKHSEETLNKLRGRKQSKETLEKLSTKRKKCILQYTIQGEFIQEFASIKEAGIKLKGIVSKATIERTLKGHFNATKFIFKYKQNEILSN